MLVACLVLGVVATPAAADAELWGEAVTWVVRVPSAVAAVASLTRSVDATRATTRGAEPRSELRAPRGLARSRSYSARDVVVSSRIYLRNAALLC
jgi:hypothetical protein